MSLDSSVGVQRKLTRKEQRQADSKTRLSSPAASAFAVLIAVVWTIPTAGLLITSFRPSGDVRKSGWWTAFANPSFTLDNYVDVFGTSNVANSFFNSFIITIPAVLIPIMLALLAAYAFAWIDFKGRSFLFAFVFALQIVPIQVTLIPLLSQYVQWGLDGTYWTVWLSHTIFGLPLAIFLLHNFMKEIPRSLIEAARVDGAGHVRVFFQVLMPLLVPAIASFAIFQFLWVWNDLLVALVFAGPEYSPITRVIATLAGSFGSRWYLLAAGAFVSMVVPMVVFFSLQRYFVRGMLAGGVKG
ncbi:carbohydrate ABC transporter permease [Propionicimonas sp.]|uniref:carbohydrate ABC transporter permease n=1 Tax=Propionicimonas sp. TaxID=1955623 RepID=UPI0017F8FD52|nr:carbohydrate ABC transporter permease [Propionicimonas sp.]MBU3977145.1 carbohydrate ABC transporter permease [Actinomycetota bacterium]MBA3020712.1 carbohydrate ABC transporter permease [Propionicimonas sp.]MBU3985085.1 carbohydrate ABC transporter permease [Actinomycetota bacterium]MBU4006958.1 carbohydrate ABC transporter permease [Actinomycetota bacterium]MBU4064711.1 carbohydrate ABC transporter permease [Actinomycetota bacterium]